MSANTPSWNWDRLMGIGIGELQMNSASFWNLTPRELSAALRARGFELDGKASLDRQVLDILLDRFPDVPPSSIKKER